MSKKRNKKSSHSKKVSQDKIAAKKAAVLGTERKNYLPVVLAAIGIVAITAVAVSYVLKIGGEATATASAPAATSSTYVSFPVSLFDDGKARHFEHVDGNMTIRYFVLKSSDGIIRAAFDACDVCWPAGKGYYQEGDHMVCRNCGRRFASVLVNEVKGGCNPAPLTRNVDSNNLVIQIKDIQQGGQYFNFDGRT
ncbi:hypothetical protein D1AOALGA4SA_2673 [Olavius algarvensis Delta 1 endosymbiont]|nr:hypothetical protein D1AOALGA4SA_2673 [Olavius algarvensis Delta 1 endosymbiont]